MADASDPTLYADLEFGRAYEEFCLMALLPNGKWLLVIANESWEDWDVRNLEKRLYDFYVEENF